MTIHDHALALFERWGADDPAFQAMLLEEEGWTADEIAAETGVVVSICYHRVGGDYCFCIADPLLTSCCQLRHCHCCPAHLSDSWEWRPVSGCLQRWAEWLWEPNVWNEIGSDSDREVVAAVAAMMIGMRSATGWCPRGMGIISEVRD